MITPEERKNALALNVERNKAILKDMEDVFDVLVCAGYRFVKVHAPLRVVMESGQKAVKWCSCGKDHAKGLASLCPDKPCDEIHCHSTGKHPIGAGWQKHSAEEWRFVKQWLLEGYNVGVYAPDGARVVAIDIDRPEVLPLIWPDGVPVTMGDSIKGKQHLFFTVPEGFDVTLLPPVFDGGEIARGGSRHLVAPLGMHPDGARKWNGVCEVINLDNDAIKRLIVMKRETDESREAATGPGDPGWQITTGRHEWFWSQLGILRNIMTSHDSLLAAARSINEDRIFPPLDDPHVVRAVRDYWDNKKAAPTPPRILFPSKDEEKAEVLKSVWLRDFSIERTEWLWKNWLAVGEAVFIEGMSAVGKSTFVMDTVARITTGSEMADGSSPISKIGSTVIYVTGEDDPSRILLPRAIAAGADPSKIRFVTESFVMPDDTDRLRHLVNDTPDCRLVFIDPLFSHIGTGKDGKSLNPNADVEMRVNIMVPLRDLARELGMTVLLSRHLNKQTGADLNMRGSGSYGGLAAASRGVILVAKDPGDETGNTKIVGPLKNQYGPLPFARRFTTWGTQVQSPSDPSLWVETALIDWGDRKDVGKNIEDYLSTADAPPVPSAVNRREHLDRIVEAVTKGGCVPSTVLEAEAVKAGYGEGMLKASRLRVGVLAHKHGVAKEWFVRQEDKDCSYAVAMAEAEAAASRLFN